MSEQTPDGVKTDQTSCLRCRGTGRVGYVMGTGQRGHTKCPDCQGSRFKASPRETIHEVTQGPANAPRASNEREKVSPAVTDNPQWTPEAEQMFSEAWEAWTWE